MLEVNLENGEVRHLLITKFDAMDGWDIQRRFIEFAASTDSEIRSAYTLEVLTYASVIIGDTPVPLATRALINSHLQTWPVIEHVFETILRQNGIDPDTHADRPNYWANAGGEFAVAFIAQVNTLIGPYLGIIAEQNAANRPHPGDIDPASVEVRIDGSVSVEKKD